MTFQEFCEYTQMDFESYDTKQAWEAFQLETDHSWYELTGWWEDNQGRFV